MYPKFKDNIAYHKAELLMQPIFIRLVDNIRSSSEQSDVEASYEETAEPYPSYLLSLSKGDKSVQVNVWHLCFQICFLDYEPNQTDHVQIDGKLIDDDGQLDWQAIESKTKEIVQQTLAQLL